jgi:hypothetical protein
VKIGNQGDGGGRPLIELTSEQSHEVGALASVLNQEQIADYLGVSRRTFIEILKRDEHVSAQYKKGKAKAIATVGANLITQAKTGNTTAAIFYLKTQAGWKETETEAQEIPPINIIVDSNAINQAAE